MSPRRLIVAAAPALVLIAGHAASQPAPALTARCAVVGQAALAAPDKNVIDKTFGFLGGGVKAVTDQFSISGKGGPYACGPETVARQIADAAALKAQAEAIARNDPKVINTAIQADTAGSLSSELLSMPKTEAQLQAIVDEIARAWPYKGVRPVRVRMVASLDYNATATSDGTIAVAVGVFLNAEGTISEDLTDSDLYFLLGHEYAHIALDHFRSQEAAEEQRRSLTRLMGQAEKGAQLASSINYAQAVPNLPVDLKQSYEDAQQGEQHLRFMMDRSIQPVFGRGREDEADAAGLDAAFLAGRMPRYINTVDMFEATEKTMQQRLETAQANMKARADKVLKDPRFESAVKQGDLAGSFGSVVDTLKKSVYESVRKVMIEISGRNHRSAKARRDGIGKYLKVAYVDGGLLPEDREATTTRTDALRALPEVAAGIAATRAALAAEDALLASPPDKDKARAQIDIALKGPFRDEPFIRQIAYQVASARGDIPGAVAHLEIARKRPNASPLLFRETIRFYATNGRLPQARTVLAEGLRLFKDKPYFLPSQILVQVRSGRYDEAEASLAACKATNRQLLIVDCKAAALNVDFKQTPPADQARLKPFGWAPAEATGKKGIPGLPDKIRSRLPWGG
ncbi:MAG: M48 family metalloprotease [Caulobacter sp.]|nr:M48 family metalloprotease [Caulobacter sp.]